MSQSHTIPEPDRLFAKLLEGELPETEREQLNQLLLDDASLRQLYREYMILDALLRWEIAPPLMQVGEEGCGTRGQRQGMVGSPMIDVSVDIEPQISNPRFPSLSPNFIGSPVFSYLTATVILGMMLLGAWAYTISHSQPQITQPQVANSPSALSMQRQEVVFVGRITGMKNCQWADPSTEPFPGASVPLGRKYALASGLMEITYKTGAKVILQGPCTFEVESPASGYLSWGKLTAKVDKRDGGRGARGESDFHDPLFSVRTPTVVIVDLGTEFGVEVNAEGNTITHVFQGKVELQLADNLIVIALGENESAHVSGPKQDVLVTRRQGPSHNFVRHFPRRVRIKLFNTGFKLKEGEADQHWLIVAASNDPTFKSRPAVVTATAPYDRWQWNVPTRSQWLSTENGPSDIDGGTYTFRTTFELHEVDLKTVVIRGEFWADNHVDAIRINGRKVKVPEHGYDMPFLYAEKFVVKDGFVKGSNILEFDVLNGGGSNENPDSPNPMGCRVELKGSALSSAKTIDDAPVAKRANKKPATKRPENTQPKGG